MNALNNYDSFIFDMDGLLIDSERVAFQLFNEASKKFNIHLSFNDYRCCIGTASVQRNQKLQHIIGSHKKAKEIIEYWDFLYHEKVLSEPLPIKDNVIIFLEKLKNSKSTKIVATSTKTDLAITKLRNCGLLSYFDTVIGGDQVIKSKPSPDIYLKAAELSNCPISKIIAFEDSELGVIAAYRAGIDVIQIPDLIPPTYKTRKLTKEIYSSFRYVA